MQTITKYLVLIILSLAVQRINAQDTIKNATNKEKMVLLKNMKEHIENEERDFLKADVETINLRLEKGEISPAEADILKKEAAKKRALNIENRIAIIDNKFELSERNGYELPKEEKQNLFGVNISNKTFNIKTEKTEPKYDIKTSNDFLFAIGFNNAIIDGESLNNSPYKFGGSGFVELGWNWKTRLLKHSNFLRLKYGFSFQWNKLNPKDDHYFVQNGNETLLQQFPSNLSKSEFRVTNLVIPVHFEFGPSVKLDKNDRIRYINNHQFKIGVGGYTGLNLGTQQKLKYNQDGHNTKQKIKQGYNTSDFIYGLSGYIGFGDTSLYVKYDLSPIFKDQAIKQNNISIGLRFDVD